MEMTTKQVEVTTTLEIDVDDAVVDEVMSEDWQRSFYTFDTPDEAIAWLAWVVNEWDGPQHVDGLAHLTPDQVRVRVTGRYQELRAALNEALAQNERFNTRYRDSEAENDQWQKKLAEVWGENERLRAHVEGAEIVIGLGKAWWLAGAHHRTEAEAAFLEAVSAYDPATWQT
jgi:hypothetical protein